MNTRRVISSALAAMLCLVMCFSVITLPAGKAEAATGTTRALLVACTDSSLGQGPFNDVMIMREALTNMGVAPENIKVVSNKYGNTSQHKPDEDNAQLTRQQITKWMDTLFENSQPEDTVLFFFSGHGSKYGQQGTFGTTNLVLSEYYPTEQLAQDLAKYNGRKVIFLDACNSGGIVNKSLPVPANVTDSQLQSDMAEELEDSMEVSTRSSATNSSYFVITAASARENSLGGTFGMLTRSLASGMGVTYPRKEQNTVSTVYYASDLDKMSSAVADQNKDKKITLSELYDHVYREAVGSVPVAYPERSNEVLFEYVAPAPSYVTSMQVKTPTENGRIEGSFEYTGPGIPVVRISGYGTTYTSRGLVAFERYLEPSVSKANDNTYLFSASGLDVLKSRVLSSEGTLVTYGFSVDVRRSNDFYALYRHPISITNSSTGRPNISFNNVSDSQPGRLLPGQQEYRLQLAFDRDCIVDVDIYDVHGQKVRTLASGLPSKMRFTDEDQRDFTMDFYWDGRDDYGRFVPGDYFQARATAHNNAGSSSTVVESRLESLRVGTTPDGISILESEATVGQSKTLALRTTATPEGAYSGADWISSDPAIATVSSKGVVKGLREGEVTIIARSKDNAELTASTKVTVTRYGWQQEANGDYFYLGEGNQRLDGWQKIDGSWYFFKNTIMQRGWVKVGNSWYYLKGSGVMATGWVKDGNWYYMKNDGTMAIGWVRAGNEWYYMQPGGSMATGWVKDEGNWYYMKSSGTMAAGWLSSGGQWYYMQSSGRMATGWQQAGGKWYYLQPDGTMAVNTTIEGRYRVGTDGALL